MSRRSPLTEGPEAKGSGESQGPPEPMPLRDEEFEVLALECLDALYGYALRLSRQPETADDLVQSTFAKALGRREMFDSPQSVRPLLFRILHNQFVDDWRARRRGPSIVSMDGLVARGPAGFPAFCADGNPRDELLKSALSDEVEAALETLDEDLRQTLMLREIEDMSYQEISDVTDVPLGTVRSRLARARRKLASILEGFGRTHGYLRSQPRQSGEHRA